MIPCPWVPTVNVPNVSRDGKKDSPKSPRSARASAMLISLALCLAKLVLFHGKEGQVEGVLHPDARLAEFGADRVAGIADRG